MVTYNKCAHIQIQLQFDQLHRLNYTSSKLVYQPYAVGSKHRGTEVKDRHSGTHMKEPTCYRHNTT